MKKFLRPFVAGLKVFFGTKEDFSNDIGKLMKTFDTFWTRLLLSFLATIITFLIFSALYHVSIKDFALNFCTNILVLFITLIFVDWLLAYRRQRKRSSIRLNIERDLADLRNLYFGVVVLLSGLALKYKVGPSLAVMLDKGGVKGSGLSSYVDIAEDLEKCWLPMIEELKEKGYMLDEQFLKLLKEQADKLTKATEHKISLFGQFYEDYILSILLTTYRLSETFETAILEYQNFKELLELDANLSKGTTSSKRRYKQAIKNRYKELAEEIYSKLAINLVGLIVYWVYLEQLPRDNNVEKLMEYWRQYS